MATLDTLRVQLPSASEISSEGSNGILSRKALDFILLLHDKFSHRRRALLKIRENRRTAFSQGANPSFYPETSYIRASRWQVADAPRELQHRTVELVGSADRKDLLEGLSSDACSYIADLDGTVSDTWEEIAVMHENLRNAVHNTQEFNEDRMYASRTKPPVLFVRPRSLSKNESSIVVDGMSISASLVDFGLYFFHNAQWLIQSGSAPYFSLPRVQRHAEARWWNQVFVFSQYHMGIPQGTIKATVEIGHLCAAYELHEILYEIRNHSAGLRINYRDYLISTQEVMDNREGYALPVFHQMDHKAPPLFALRSLVTDTCKKRNTPVIGSVSLQDDSSIAPEYRRKALCQEKQTEAREYLNATTIGNREDIMCMKIVFNKDSPAENLPYNFLEDPATVAQSLLYFSTSNPT